jgi:hypothetical protein
VNGRKNIDGGEVCGWWWWVLRGLKLNAYFFVFVHLSLLARRGIVHVIVIEGLIEVIGRHSARELFT